MLRQNSHITTCIENSLQQYFTDLDGQPAHDVYQMVLQQVELPLLRCVMAHCEGNQSKAADMLGLNRNTLRKKFTNSSPSKISPNHGQTKNFTPNTG